MRERPRQTIFTTQAESGEKSPFDRYSEELRRWLDHCVRTPEWIPRYTDLAVGLERLHDENGSFIVSMGESREWRQLLDKHHIFELYTEEYVKALARYIGRRGQNLAESVTPLLILEVGAGTGNLTRLLRDAIKSEPIGDEAIFIATDSGKWHIPSPWDFVELIDERAALEKYQPSIVICSWMPYGEDWSIDFRNTRSVEEYILVGPTGTTGTEATWSIPLTGRSKLGHGENRFTCTDHPNINQFQISRTDFMDIGTLGDLKSKTTSFLRTNKSE